MQLRKFFFFTLVFAALVFCISCKGKDDKYGDIDDDITVNDDDKATHDADKPVPVTDEDTDDGGDTVIDDSDTPDADSDTDATEPSDDSDTAEIPEEDDPVPDEDDTDPVDIDTDTDDEDIPELPDIDEKEDPAVICTGQTQCFNSDTQITCPASPDAAFYGQDAQYAANGYCLNKSFTTTSETVTDNITGLVWQRVLPSTYEGCTGNSGALCLHSQAIDYCTNLEYAGFDDWRLPTPAEFATIIDFGKTAPAVDPDIFPTPKTQNKNFWTRSYSVSSNTKIWYVDFTSGSTQEDDNISKYVRCVRGESIEAPLFQTMDEEAEEIVYDSVHNLFWTKNITTEDFTWKKALRYCQDLEYGGYRGWRLPSINERASIIDYSSTKPASKFPDLPSTYFWSSTSYQGYSGNAWRMISSNGRIENGDKTNTAKVLCVK